MAARIVRVSWRGNPCASSRSDPRGLSLPLATVRRSMKAFAATPDAATPATGRSMPAPSRSLRAISPRVRTGRRMPRCRHGWRRSATTSTARSGSIPRRRCGAAGTCRSRRSSSIAGSSSATAWTSIRSPGARHAGRLQARAVHLRRHARTEGERPGLSPASACIRRSIAPSISTRSLRSSAPAISAPWPRARPMDCRRAAWH